MNREDIIRIAREAGLTEIVRRHDDGTVTLEVPHLPRVLMFATLVAAAEREECAKVAEEATAAWTQHVYNDACMHIAAVIRGRK